MARLEAIVRRKAALPDRDRLPPRRSAVFLYGFAKNERSNIGAEELDEFRRLARGLLELTAQQIGVLIAENELMEVNDDEGA